MKKYIRSRFLRFLVVGGINTITTYVIYLGLLLFFPYWAAFSIAFALGVFLSYVLNALLVFDSSLSWTGLTRFPLVYLFQYGAGLALLAFQVDMLAISERIAPLINVAILTPLTFLLVRFIFNRSRNEHVDKGLPAD